MSKKLPFEKVLIANRGEIAVRIIRACKELHLKTVAVYSEVDKRSAHVALADEAIFIGEAQANQSYLNMEKIFAAAKMTGAQAIHPGFGFFSENEDFAEECIKRKIIFIGPKPEVIRLMGDKLEARATMKAAGVPIVPGSEEPLKDLKEAISFAKKIGFPVLLKAAGGGGGKGMRRTNSIEELEKVFDSVKREALSYFDNDAVFIEKFVESPHHIEVQVFGDKHGNVVHCFERECSVQRRHQKVIEEAPSPFLVDSDNIREKLFKIAVQGAKKIGYDNAGTMEFIVDGKKNFYFLEMNTRIQVEHAVTEMITGIDLVREQILVAAGLPLSFSQKDLVMKGAAIQCRLYAEEPINFLPSPGKIIDSWFPSGPFVRVDTAIMNGDKIPLEYDPMIAKLCAWGRSREEALSRMQRVLSETMIAGSITNLNFLCKALEHPVFHKGIYTTHFIEEFSKDLKNPSSLPLGITKDEMKILQELATKLEKPKAMKSEPANWWRAEPNGF